MTGATAVDGRASVLWAEARKLPAFFGRDVRIQWSYRVPFLFDWVNLIGQVALFYLVGRLVDNNRLPRFGGSPPTYVEFVAIGIALSSFLQIGLARVVNALRTEQVIGTLESLLTTPTSPVTIQLGAVMYDLVYVPVRTTVFLALVSLLLGARFSMEGILPAAAILLVFIPLVWGLGMVSAAGVLVFKRGAGVAGVAALVLSTGSSTYAPVEAFPGWLQPLARLNPATVALDAIREALLARPDWSAVFQAVLVLVPLMIASLAAGVAAFAVGLRRERRRGTLGLY